MDSAAVQGDEDIRMVTDKLHMVPQLLLQCHTHDFILILGAEDIQLEFHHVFFPVKIPIIWLC